MTFSPHPRTTSLRSPEKLSYDADDVYAILDEAYVCHIGYLGGDVPRVLPTAHSRVGDTVYFHGSTGSRIILNGRDEGLDICLTVTIHDGIILSRSWFHHSMNYRCVVAHGRAFAVTDEIEKHEALAALVDKLAPHRSAQSRPPSPREMAQTGVMALRLREVSVKSRQGGPGEDPADVDLPYWAGELPLRTSRLDAIPSDDNTVELPHGSA